MMSLRVVYDAWLRSGRRFALYYYEVSNGEDTQQFAPTHHVDISTAEPRKAAPKVRICVYTGPEITGVAQALV